MRRDSRRVRRDCRGSFTGVIESMRAWTVREAAELYGIPYWGGDYFSVSAEGDILVHPNGPGTSTVNLRAVVEELRGRGLRTPMLVILLGVIGGTLAYGITGLFLGPIILAVIWELLATWVKERHGAAEEGM